MQVIDKGLDQDSKITDQLKSDFRSSKCAATDNIPQKQQTLLSASTSITPPSAVDDIKKESYYGKIHSIQTPQEEKARMILKDVPPSLNERKFFLMKESSVLQVEKKAVPIKEFNILSPGKFKSIEAQKYKDIKNSDPLACNQVGSEAPAMKPSLVLPPLKDAALKNNSLDPSPKKSKTALSQASETTFHAVSETISSAQFFKTKEQKFEKRIGSILDAVKEQIKMQEVASLFPRLSKTSFFSRNLDQSYWPCAFLPDRKVAAVSNSIAMRRNKHPNSMHFLHTKGLQVSKASEIRDPCTGSRSHSGTNQGNGSKPQEIPVLSGLFPSLTEQGWGRATPFACCKISKKPRRNKILPRICHQKITSSLKKNMDWVDQLGSKKQKNHDKFPKIETISSNQEIGVASIKPYKMTTNSEREIMRKKLNSIQTLLGEEKTLPIKEYEINYSKQWTRPKVMRHKETNLSKVIHSNLSYITLNALLVFRQDEFGVINIHLEPPLNNEATAAKRTKREDATPDEMVSHRPATKKVKPKNRKKIGMNNVVEKSNTKIMYHSLICPQDSGILSFSEICWVFSVA
ncbi:uncharacterized protein C16orf46 homolog isoform X2 [Anolis carolinensis]|nr:PREDICTED: uncharacterized protein C16orf46 homolog isoform X2 [Anolis carolinensis]XP_016850256.1 PREDICTED: uncharacterized protein C16orf46 homolog isoform X2 [Anolis carolinensis]|eukprot:XP_016850255.1 PREDICTED: uncharacterized protein C16orf46 homolog isoform X2 [Anolis carolinensis]